MKQFFLLAVTAIFLVSCNQTKKTDSTSTAEEAVDKTSLTTDVKTFELDDLLKIADLEVGKKIKVRGYVTHTCKHSGMRCFIAGEEKSSAIRVEAGGEIGGFNRELVGSKLEILGTLKERRLTKEYIDQMEKGVNEKKAKEDGSVESCQAELKNIGEMKTWMNDHNKEYYAIYYMDGENYEVVN